MSDHDQPGPSDSPGAPGDAQTLERRMEALESELSAARDEARVNHDRWLRERADLENVKKRAGRERQDAVRYGNESLARDLLPVIDNLERALAAAADGGDGESLVRGVAMVRDGLMDTLQRHGVERLRAEGERFDPAVHEAVAHVESDAEPHRVIEEHRAGYRLNDRLLRAAMVTVSKGKAETSKLANEEGGG
jgi:molecular chaperone GrpE